LEARRFGHCCKADAPTDEPHTLDDVDEAEIAEHIRALEELEDVYRRYISAGQAGDRQAADALRADLLRRSTRAQRAIAASGLRFVITPPPMFSGPVLSSLADQLFAFERPGWEDYHLTNNPPYAAQLVLDALIAAVGALEDDLYQIRRAPQQLLKVDQAKRQRPPRILIGRIRGVPTAVGFLADLATVGVVIAAAAKGVGLW
jgi:hypothetical protein